MGKRFSFPPKLSEMPLSKLDEGDFIYTEPLSFRDSLSSSVMSGMITLEQADLLCEHLHLEPIDRKYKTTWAIFRPEKQ